MRLAVDVQARPSVCDDSSVGGVDVGVGLDKVGG